MYLQKNMCSKQEHNTLPSVSDQSACPTADDIAR